MLNQIKNKVHRRLSGLKYKARLAKHSVSIPSLSSSDRKIVDALGNEGVCVTSLDALALPHTPLMLEAVESLLPNRETVKGSELEGRYFALDTYTVHANYTQMARDYPEIYLWGLQDRMLNIIENYIGLPVALLGADVRQDIAKGKDIGSRRWHKDGEDRRVVRVIIYLNDVSTDGVAFEYIPKYLTPPNLTRGILLDEEMEKIVPQSNWKQCLGPAGTVVFAATSSILHHGKVFVESGTDRMALFYAYTSRKPTQPDICKPHFSKEGMSFLEGKLSQRQRECIFWY